MRRFKNKYDNLEKTMRSKNYVNLNIEDRNINKDKIL
jgi:hypothetical protein